MASQQQPDAAFVWACKVLGRPPTASLRELRESYLDAAKRLHPDRGGKEASAAAFVVVQTAWETARGALESSSGGASFGARAGPGAPSVVAMPQPHQFADLDDMGFDEARDAYTLRCRCGDEFVAPTAALDAGVSVFPCGSCSLRLGVEFERVAEPSSPS